MKKWLISFMILSSIFIVTACGSDDSEEVGEAGQPQTIEINEDEKMTDDDVVALVNGAEITGNKYNIIYPQIKMYVTQMEEEVELDIIKERTIDALIDQELIYQGAEEEGVVVTEEEISEKFTEIKAESEEELDSLLEQFHLTEEGFKDQLMFEETMEQFVDLVVEVDVTEEDVKQHYDEIKAENDQVPEFDEVKDQLEMQLIKQIKDEELESIVIDMKEKADIEKKV